MNSTQDLVADAQAQALEALRSGQAAALETVQAWSQAVGKFAPPVPAFSHLPGAKEAIGDPTAIVDSVYDFAASLLELNKQFVHSCLEASAEGTKGVQSATAEKPAGSKK